MRFRRFGIPTASAAITFIALVIVCGAVASLTQQESSSSLERTAQRPNASLVWFAPIFSHSGYGKEALEYLLAMDVVTRREKRSDDDDDDVGGGGGSDPGRSDRAAFVRMVGAVGHGDTDDVEVLRGYPSEVRRRLQRLVWNARWLDEEAYVCTRGSSPPPSHPIPVSVSVCHSEPGAWSVPDPLYPTTVCPPWFSQVAIARTMFETDRIPAGWVERLNRMDAVWVPTEFHVETFASSGVSRDKLVVIPEAIDVDPRSPSSWTRGRCRSQEPPAEEGEMVRRFFASMNRRRLHEKCAFRFLSIFKWEDRKGWDVLLSAFYEEFVANPVDDIRREDEQHGLVCLVLKTSAYHDEDREEGDDDEDAFDGRIDSYLRDTYGAKYRRRRAPSSSSSATLGAPSSSKGAASWLQIHIVHDRIDSASFPLLYCGVHALVQPSRGEGWGRPHCEAMAMGVPVIATNWSGTTAFFSEVVGYPVAIEPELRAVGKGPFADHRWAEPSRQHLRARMREVVRASRLDVGHPLRNALEAKTRAATRLMREKFNAPLVVDSMLHHVEATVRRVCDAAPCEHHDHPEECRCADVLPRWGQKRQQLRLQAARAHSSSSEATVEEEEDIVVAEDL